MDPDIARWILEYVLRSSLPDSDAKKISDVLPISVMDSRVRKTMFLRSIQSEVSSASITESILDTFEMIEELDRVDGIAITETMKQAYCAVAVECTIRYLDTSPDDNNNNQRFYSEAVERIWRSRIRQMEAATASGEGSDLWTAELKNWGDEIDAAFWDSEVHKRLVFINSRQIALRKVRVYLAETWQIMGPPFLELAATMFEVNVACQNSNLLLRNKHSASSSQQGGVKFFCDEKVGPIQALVNDPLPDVLLKSELAEESISHEPPLENQNRNVDVPEPNNTAHTCEQGGSKINSLDGTLKRRRKGKRWTSLEEQMLHDGVNKFGKGNWKAILTFYDEIFKEAGRTEVDLKDKWRNMNRQSYRK
ncbi:uncharacterized protein G2W53_031245 [Senna tora]|uniref:Uncharacterized protein n=1 Tax=Senna tora TaxID=362788 RepID=A0A834TAB8_9FABA|nr:uncharacterized protein G2W53_031245 [Senna tora]